MVTEVDFRNYLPPSVVYYTARLHQSRDSAIGSPENYRGLVESAPEAARSVALANPELLVYSCTSGSFFKGPNWHLELSKQIEAAAAIPTITTSTAVLAALKAVKARKIFMVSPYPDSVNDQEVNFLAAHGFQVQSVLNLGCTKSQEVFKLTPQSIVEAILQRRSEVSGKDVAFITCTGLRSVEVVDSLEHELGVPVVTSNSASLWLALLRLGVDAGEIKAGRLFALQKTDAQNID
jgi:maleate isomerase